MDGKKMVQNYYFLFVYKSFLFIYFFFFFFFLGGGGVVRKMNSFWGYDEIVHIFGGS